MRKKTLVGPVLLLLLRWLLLHVIVVALTIH